MFVNSEKTTTFFSKLWLYLDDGVGERVRDDVEQVGGVLARLDVEGVDQDLGEFVQNTCGDFQRQENQHRQPVEEVVDRGAGKCPAKGRNAVMNTYTVDCRRTL